MAPRKKEQACPSGAPPVDDQELATLLDLLDWRGTAPQRRLLEAALERFGSLAGLLAASPFALVEAGIPENKAKAITQAPRACEQRLKPGSIGISSSRDVAQYLWRRYGHEKQEIFVLLPLDARNHVLADVVVSRGTLSSCPVHPREVFRAAILQAAASLILAHNHPSGGVEPSNDDLALTRRLVRAGTLIGIPVLDHIIVGQTRELSYTSLAERGLMS